LTEPVSSSLLVLILMELFRSRLMILTTLRSSQSDTSLSSLDQELMPTG
jgi:hypothetical protein